MRCLCTPRTYQMEQKKIHTREQKKAPNERINERTSELGKNWPLDCGFFSRVYVSY